MSFADYLRHQVKGFWAADKKIKRARDSNEAVLSRAVAVVLTMIGILLYASLIFVAPVTLRMHVRLLLIELPLLFFIICLYRGISIPWLVEGLLKWWLVPLLLFYAYFVLFNAVDAVLTGTGWLKVGIYCGVLLLSGGGVALVALKREEPRRSDPGPG